ncbi:DUF6216 family protein [Cupriavidus alkaliphilus]|uniref:Uncharacterized protein n=1 Tax=Cupriavidus alkaliphilus TaxID=942866 RepID=A0A7W4YU80_9BURK|nr:DUF6216 family protein [Cupriavidus alkaliphilus]MBB3010242.1 hypothetical protein [Cupriavidus alkaliphilus]
MDSFSSFVQSPLFSRLSVASLSVGLVAFFWWRAGSIHSILERLWLLIAGKTEVHNTDLKAIFQENRDLERFRFLYRLKVETMKDVKKLVSWMGENGIGMFRLQKMSAWIDVRTPEILVQPPRHFVPIRLAIACASFLAMVCVGQLAASQFAYFQMRESKIWFKTDATTISAPLGGWTFTAAECSNSSRLSQMTGFLESETEVICKGLQGKSIDSLVKQTVKFQSWAGLVFMLITLITAILNILTAVAAQEAARLWKRLHEPVHALENSVPCAES